MKLRPTTLRHWVIAVFGAIGVGLFPWTIWLSASLKAHHETRHWVRALAAATGTLLITDAWFDIALESHSDEIRTAVYLAVFAELPLAALCFWIAYRTERFLSLLVREALHLTSAAESPTQRDLIGVLEVTPDGKPAREPSDADPPASAV